jgi:outer membrane autotransporter protein
MSRSESEINGFGIVHGGLFSIDSGWNGFLTGAIQFGEDDYRSYSGNLGIRYNW